MGNQSPAEVISRISHHFAGFGTAEFALRQKGDAE